MRSPAATTETKQSLEEKKIDTWQQIKIWFSPNSQEWITPLNLERLKRHKALCPNHVIHVVIAKAYLEPEARKKAEEDCKAMGVICWDIDEDIPKLIEANVSEEQKTRDKLVLAAAKEQLNLFFKKTPSEPDLSNCPGNLAAASDALRCVSALLEGRMYCDFDVPILKEEPRFLERDFITHVFLSLGALTINNCIMAASKKSETLIKIQKELIERQRNLNAMDFRFLTKWVSQLYGPHTLTRVMRDSIESTDTIPIFIGKFGISEFPLFRQPEDLIALQPGKGDLSWLRREPIKTEVVDMQELKKLAMEDVPSMYFPDLSEAEAIKRLIEWYKKDNKKHFLIIPYEMHNAPYIRLLQIESEFRTTERTYYPFGESWNHPFLDSSNGNKLSIEQIIQQQTESNYIPVVNPKLVISSSTFTTNFEPGLFSSSSHSSDEKAREAPTSSLEEEAKKKGFK